MNKNAIGFRNADSRTFDLKNAMIQPLRIIHAACRVIISVAIIGCASGSDAINKRLTSVKSGVFFEISETNALLREKVVVSINACLKTNCAGYYLLESKGSPYGKPTFRFMFSIDGQTAVWEAPGNIDNVPKYFENGKTNCAPCAGEGMLYRLEKRIALAPGTHRVFFALPDDGYNMEFEVSLNENKAHRLELKPEYGYSRMIRYPFRRPTFRGGIKKYSVSLNGAAVNAKIEAQ